MLAGEEEGFRDPCAALALLRLPVQQRLHEPQPPGQETEDTAHRVCPPGPLAYHDRSLENAFE